MTSHARKAVGWTAAALATFAAVLALQILSKPPAAGWTAPRVVVIPKGSNSGAAIHLLTSGGVVRHPFAFRVLVFASRSGRKLHFGEYTFDKPLAPIDVWRKLVAGDVTKYAVTIPPGSNLYDIARILDSTGLASEAAFLDAAHDPALLRRMGIDAPSAEGYLFPETYQLVKEQTPEEIIGIMHREFVKRFTDEMAQRARRQGYSVTQILTMASIIEKETASPQEKPLVSAIIRRRLAIGMPLQMDPTVIYGHRLFGKDITKKALQTG
ncbi:MAG TPA: endolytic transglycosylase MltG, partial [Candidatus Deferrimicrobiaceae bacterium]